MKEARNHILVYRVDHANERRECRHYRVYRDRDGYPTMVRMTVYRSHNHAQDRENRCRPWMYREPGVEMFYGSAFADELSRVFDSAERSR